MLGTNLGLLQEQDALNYYTVSPGFLTCFLYHSFLVLDIESSFKPFLKPQISLISPLPLIAVLTQYITGDVHDSFSRSLASSVEAQEM